MFGTTKGGKDVKVESIDVDSEENMGLRIS